MKEFSESRSRIIGICWTICSFLLLISACSKSFEPIPLADGRTILVLRDIEDVYPVYGATFKAEFDLALKTKEEIIDTNLGGKYERDIKSLYENLDQINMDVRTSLVSGYSTLIASLSTAASEQERERAMARWDNIQQEVIKLSYGLRRINKQADSAKTRISNTEWEKLISIGKEMVDDSEALKNLK